MTFDEMVTFVRAHADADSTDAPSSSLTVYARMAYNDILARRQGWPHLAVNYTLTTINNQATYTFTGGSFSVPDLDIVTGVIDQSSLNRRLVAITQQDADLFYGGTAAPKSTNAAHYTLSGNSLTLYPTPSSAKAYLVRGFREPSSWPVSGGDSPDAPRVFDEAICWFMLSQYFLSQEDTQLASMYMNEYQEQVDRWAKSESNKSNLARPNVMGGQQRATRGFEERVRGMLE